MSWISKNYEKAVFGAAVVAAGGLAYMGWSKVGSVDVNFGSTPKGPSPAQKNPAIKSAGLVAQTKSSFEVKREWTEGEDEGRSVDLFTGVALFVRKDDQNKLVDLIEGDEVHHGIPNSWWLEYRIDPGFGDSPQRDEDGDGFSNQEEFVAKTDPTNAKQFPLPIMKLTFIREESVQWVLRPGFESGGGSFTFTYGDNKGGNNRVGAATPVPVGGVFFANGAAAGRFKLLGHEIRSVVNEQHQNQENVTFVKVEDLKQNKKGTVHEIPASFRVADQRKHAKFDRTAVLSLAALGRSGQEFKVEENTPFSLPLGEEKKPYVMKEVTAERIMIEFTAEDGRVVPYEILKGATGPAAP